MRQKIETFVYPLITLAVVVTIWILYIRNFNVPDYILPEPLAVLERFISAYVDGFIWPHFLFTLRTTVIGYSIGCCVGFLLGIIIAESDTVEKFLYPYVVLLQSMPKIALAPLLIVWFGFGIESKIAMVVLMCFFPVFVNTMVGIRQVDNDLIDVMRVCSASLLRILFHVKIPSAAGSIFAGLQISVVLGLIGAVVAEFVAARIGLGTLLQLAQIDLDMALMLAIVFSLAIMGLSGNLFVRYLHRRIVFWEGQKQHTGSTDSA
jgi:NitT/TauT family transport system permease protein